MVSQTNCTRVSRPPMIKARFALDGESDEIDSDWMEVEKVVLE